MERIVRRCAGLDVHRKVIVACALLMDEAGRVEKRFHTVGTMTRDLRTLREWLAPLRVSAVAMESTGVLWKPVFNVLEEGFDLLLCNARHIKNVPGRKTDVQDAEWIAPLLQHGLLTGSFVPARPQRELRDLTRHRAQRSGEKTREVNRIHKILEDANIQLGAVATDIMGKSGRDMIRARIDGQKGADAMSELARGRLRAKPPALRGALEGRVSEHHRFMLKKHMEHAECLERAIAGISERIETLIASKALDTPRADPSCARGASQAPSERPSPTITRVGAPMPPGAVQPEPAAPRREETHPLPFAQAVALLDGVPGIDITSAVNIPAETGTDMSRFPTDKHLASWSRIRSGNDESAGKHKSGKTGKGNRRLRRTRSEAAWAAARTKQTYFSAQYRRLAGRRGKRRAIMAVAHSILVCLYHMLRHQRAFQDLGADFFDKLNPDRLTRYHVKRLESLGSSVTLAKAA